MVNEFRRLSCQKAMPVSQNCPQWLIFALQRSSSVSNVDSTLHLPLRRQRLLIKINIHYFSVNYITFLFIRFGFFVLVVVFVISHYLVIVIVIVNKILFFVS